MANSAELSLIVRAVDKATGPLKAITDKLDKANAPFRKMSATFDAFGKQLDPIKKVGGALSGVGSAASNVAGQAVALGMRFAAASAAAGLAFYTIIESAVEAGDKLGEMAQRTGLAVDVYASLAYSAAQADVEQEAFNSAMDKFNKNLGEAKAGGGALLSFLNKVSPTLGKQVTAAKSTEEALSLMTDAFTRIEDPAKMAALSAAAFGKSGLQMGQWLHQGNKAIQESQVRYFGLAGSQEEFAKQSGVVDNMLKDAAVSATSVRNAIALALYPAVQKISAAFTDFVSKHRTSFADAVGKMGTAISAWLDGGGPERLFTALGKISDALGWVVDKLGPTGIALAAAAVAALPLVASVGSLAIAGVNLGVALFGALPAIMAVGATLLPILPVVLAVSAAVLALGAAGYFLFTRWNDLGVIFDDIIWKIENVTQKMGGLFGVLKSSPAAFIGNLFAGPTEDGALSPEARARAQRFSGASLAQARPSSSTQTNNASVSVDFSNVPAGAAVRTGANNTAPLNMSVGYGMSTP